MPTMLFGQETEEMSEAVDSLSRDSSVNERLLQSLQSQVLMLDSLSMSRLVAKGLSGGAVD